MVTYRCCFFPRVIVAWLCIVPIVPFVHTQHAQNFLLPDEAPEVQAVAAVDLITVDGRLNERSWHEAPVIEDFFRMEPRQGGTYRYPTRVQVVYDAKNIYFGVFARDSLGRKGLRVQDFRRDFIYGENDVIYIQLDPQNLRRYCMSFQTTPLGTQRPTTSTVGSS